MYRRPRAPMSVTPFGLGNREQVTPIKRLQVKNPDTIQTRLPEQGGTQSPLQETDVISSGLSSGSHRHSCPVEATIIRKINKLGILAITQISRWRTQPAQYEVIQFQGLRIYLCHRDRAPRLPSAADQQVDRANRCYLYIRAAEALAWPPDIGRSKRVEAGVSAVSVILCQR